MIFRKLWKMRKNVRSRPKANPTGVNNAGQPVEKTGIEYTELPGRVKEALKQINAGDGVKSDR